MLPTNEKHTKLKIVIKTVERLRKNNRPTGTYIVHGGLFSGHLYRGRSTRTACTHKCDVRRSETNNVLQTVCLTTF